MACLHELMSSRADQSNTVVMQQLPNSWQHTSVIGAASVFAAGILSVVQVVLYACMTCNDAVYLDKLRVCMAAQLGFTAHQHLCNGKVAMPQSSSESRTSPPVCQIHIGIIPVQTAFAFLWYVTAGKRLSCA